MTDREKVIKGVECCVEDAKCVECPYNKNGVVCSDRLIDDLKELLKEHEPEWISVKDKGLPEIAGCMVLVSAQNVFGQTVVFPAFQGYGDSKWYTMDKTKMTDKQGGTDNTVSKAWKITHWMPLPEPPKED